MIKKRIQEMEQQLAERDQVIAERDRTIVELREQGIRLGERLTALEDQRQKDRHNSSKPHRTSRSPIPTTTILNRR